jgi:hypothetical protein
MIFNEIKKAVQSALDFLHPIIDSKEPKTFKGTTAEWNALTPTEQAAFEVKYITDDVPVLPDYIKVKSYYIYDITQPQGNDLTSRTTAALDSGYKFLSYVNVNSDGWVTDYPIYTAMPWNIEGSLWTRSDNPVPTGLGLVVTFLEIKE